MNVINVTDWVKDERYAVFPIGARDKEMIWSPKTEIQGIKAEWPYLFKESIVRYPDQFWTEVVAYIVSKHLDVDVPKVCPAIKITEDGSIVCGSLIKWFYDVSKDRFMHGGAFLKRIIPDFDDKTGKEHNLDDVTKIIRILAHQTDFKIDRKLWLFDMVLFDTLIGNTDRHQENWGFIFCSNSKNVFLSPFFDNGTSLGHERFVENVKDWDNQRITAYVKKGCHHLRFHRDEPKERIGHFTFIEMLMNVEGGKKYIQNKIEQLNFANMLAEIENLTAIDNIDIPFSRERYEWIKKNLEIRFDLIKEELAK